MGKYISDNTRKGVWGTEAIETINEQLRRELPGSKTKTLEERVFYIHQAATLHCDKYTLRDNLKADLFHHQSQCLLSALLNLPLFQLLQLLQG